VNLEDRMEIVMWVATGLLAAAFLGAGLLKLSQPKERLATSGMGWVEDFSPRTIKLIATAELAGAIGLIVPPLVGIAPVLAPIAAACLAVTMLGAVVVHLRRREFRGLMPALILMFLAIFVAVGRFAIVPF
jgi:hypothetical protein